MKDVPALLLLATILTPGPRGFPGTTLVHSCTVDTTINGANRVENIATVNGISKEEEKAVYMNCNRGFRHFQGVSVVVKSGGSGGETGWFPLNSTCFPNNDEWCVVWVKARLLDSNKIKLQLRTSECHYVCTKDVAFRSFDRFQVRGHGTSGWGNNPCGEVKDRKNGAYQDTPPSCNLPPSSMTSQRTQLGTTSKHPREPGKTPTTPSTTTTPSPTPITTNKPTASATSTEDPPPTSMPIKVVAGIAAGAVVAVVMVVVGIVVVVVCLRKRGDTLREDVPMQHLSTEQAQEDRGADDRRDSANSIYQPFNGQDVTTSIQEPLKRQDSVNSTYEPFKRQESVNSIYEPFQRRDSTNSLYEPCQNLATGQYESK